MIEGMKKEALRFTLRFGKDAPKYIRAAHVLNAAGRGIRSLLIADLIDERIKKYGENAFVDYFLTSALPKDFFDNITITHVVAHAESTPVPMPKPGIEAISYIEPSHDTVQSITSLDNEPLDDEIHDAVLNGLSMFNKA